ncbi:MAG TPA: Gfo/Idh/MocA family oxidoreductase, partial [Gemmataceae bacterium]
LGEVLELRGRGKEDSRGGGQDLMVLGTHIMDLMRLLGGDARWCFARAWQGGRPAVVPGDVRMGGEEIGPILGDRITAVYGFDGPAVGHFATHKAKDGAGRRFGLFVHGSKGVVFLRTGTLPEAYFLDDPAWVPAKGTADWKPITSAGVGKPEPLKDGSLVAGNKLIVEDLFAAIEEDRRPRGSGYDGRAALEMILAVYESHRQGRPVDLPLKNRKHPLR